MERRTDYYEDCVRKMVDRFETFKQNVPSLVNEIGVNKTNELLQQAQLDYLLYDPHFNFVQQQEDHY